MAADANGPVDLAMAVSPRCPEPSGAAAAALMASWLAGRDEAPLLGPGFWGRATARLKPGGHAALVCGPQASDLACVALRMAGLEVRDTLRWAVASGRAGCVILARRPLAGTVAQNVLAHGAGGLNIDACRVGTTKDVPASPSRTMGTSLSGSADGSLRRATGDAEKESGFDPNVGRWPANFLHDGSEAVLKAFAAFGEKEAPQPRIMRRGATTGTSIGGHGTYGTSAPHESIVGYGDQGSAARFFAAAAAPVDLLRWLARLAVPPGGLAAGWREAGGERAQAACLAEGVRFSLEG